MKQRQGRIWVLSEVYYPEETGVGHYATGVAEHWAIRHSVGVLAVQPSYSRAGLKAPKHEFHRGVEIFRCWAILPAGKTLLDRLLKMATVTLSLSLNAIFRVRRGDCLYVLTSPPSLAMLAPLIAWMCRVPYVIQVCDLYPEITAACGLTKTDSLSYRLLKWLSRLSLRKAAKVVVVGRDVKERISDSRSSDSVEDAIFIPWWADSEDVLPRAKAESPLARELGLMEKFVVLYAGNMGYPQNVEALVEAARRLQSDPEIHFVFLGFGSKKHLLEQLVADGAKNLTVLDVRPRDEQGDFLNAGDLGIVTLIPGMEGLGVPSRMYNLMAAGKPVLALIARDSEVAQVIREHEIGWVVEQDEIEGSVSAIRAAMANREGLKAMAGRARAAAETRFSKKTIMESFDRLIEGLV